MGIVVVPSRGLMPALIKSDGAGNLTLVASDGGALTLTGGSFSTLTVAGGVTLGATTITEAEAAVLSGVVAGTASAGLAAVLGAAKNLDTLSVATLLAPTSVTVGGGTAITKIVVYAPSLDVASVAANTTAEQLFAVVGLTLADKVFVNKPSLTAGLGVVNARVSAVGQLAITFVNATAAAIDPVAETYAVVAMRS